MRRRGKTSREKRNFSRYPILWLASALAFGIASSKLFILHPFVTVTLLLLLALAITISVRTWSTIGILFAFIACGLFLGNFAERTIQNRPLRGLLVSGKIVSGDPVEAEGILETAPEIGVGRIEFNLRIDQIRYKESLFQINGRIRFFGNAAEPETFDKYLTLRAGDRLRIASRIFREERFRNPGGFDLLAEMDRNGIDANGEIKSFELIQIIQMKEGFAPMAYIGTLRNSLILSISETFPPDASGILIASNLGNRDYLTKQTAEVFRAGGTFHVLVISGLHITFIGWLLYLIVGYFTRNNVLRFLLTIIPLWLYALAIGGNAPVLRAALMFTIVLLASVIHRDYYPLNGFGASILILLAINPESIFAPSLQLTAVSVGAIISIVFPILEKMREIGQWQPSSRTPFPPSVPRIVKSLTEALYWNENRWEKTLRENLWSCRIFKTEKAARLSAYGLQKPLRFLFEGLLASGIVQIAMLPLTVFYFHRTGIASIFLNFWVGFWMLFLTIFAGFALVLGKIAIVFRDAFVVLANVCVWMLIELPEYFVGLARFSYRLPLIKVHALYLLYLIPVVVFAWFAMTWNPFDLRSTGARRKHRFRILLASLITNVILQLVIIFHPFSHQFATGNLTIDFIDVGQGDSALVTFPQGTTLLVDGGGRRTLEPSVIKTTSGEDYVFEPDLVSIGEAVVSPFLWEKGIARLDFVLATHADADHLEGLISVTRNFKPKKVVFGSYDVGDIYYDQLLETAQIENSAVIYVHAGNRFEIDGVLVEVLNPQKPPLGKSTNDNSIVLLLTFGERRFLLTADIEKPAELTIMAKNHDLKADVLKVAHHGSKTSSVEELIDSVKPEIAVVPVGRRSPFGHPNREVMDRLKASGARIMTTGNSGTITISTDGKNLDVNTFVKGTNVQGN